jgi:hypothetical protein
MFKKSVFFYSPLPRTLAWFVRFTGDGKNAQMLSMGDEKYSNPLSVLFDDIPPIGSRNVQNE